MDSVCCAILVLNLAFGPRSGWRVMDSTMNIEAALVIKQTLLMGLLLHKCMEVVYCTRLLTSLALRPRSGWSALEENIQTGLEIAVDDQTVLSHRLMSGCTTLVVSLALLALLV